MPPDRTSGPRTPQLGALGRAIKQARVEAKLSQEELAARTGVHATHVRGLERGVRNPTYHTLHRVAKGLGLKVGQLVALADELEESGE